MSFYLCERLITPPFLLLSLLHVITRLHPYLLFKSKCSQLFSNGFLPFYTKTCYIVLFTRGTSQSGPAIRLGSGGCGLLFPPPLLVPGKPVSRMGDFSRKKRGHKAAYPQWIVTTRLLYHLQDRVPQLSRMQRL